MGVIRGFFLVIVSVLLFLSIFSSALLLTLTSSLNYNNLQKESKEIVKGLLENSMNISSAIDEVYPFIQTYCQNNSEYVFNSEGYTFTIPCSVALEGKEAVIDKGIDYLIEGIYYKEYDCDFVQCFQNDEIPTFILSNKSYTLVNNAFKISLLIILLLMFLTFLLIKKKANFFILVGILMIISALPFLKLKDAINLLPEKIVAQIVGLFFSTSFSTSIIMLIVGILLIITGIILKIFKVGFFVSDTINKFSKPKLQKPLKKGVKITKKKSK